MELWITPNDTTPHGFIDTLTEQVYRQTASNAQQHINELLQMSRERGLGPEEVWLLFDAISDLRPQEKADIRRLLEQSGHLEPEPRLIVDVVAEAEHPNDIGRDEADAPPEAVPTE